MPNRDPHRPLRVAVTLGDPAGVGPEIVAKALSDPALPSAQYVLVGPARHFEREATKASGGPDTARASFTVVPEHALLEGPLVLDDALGGAGPVLIEPAREGDLRSGGWPEVEPGAVCVEGGEAAFRAVALAARLALAGTVDAICTAPLHKKALNLAGHAYPGHTEILAEACGARRVVMLLQGGGLRVALATIHLPLGEVAGRLSAEGILKTIRITHAALRRDWAMASPRIAVTGLNPHAGDCGLLGSEEGQVIEPAIESARAEGMNISGPLAADTVFHQMLQGKYDVVVAMYHDQGLTALKTLAFDEGVNITLGLPFVRTSPDHGTAMDIAGKGVANPKSLLCALRDAVDLANARRRQTKG